LFLFRPLDLVVPAGTSQTVALFELVGARAGPDRAPDAAFVQCREWRQALDLYRSRDWGGAITALRAFAEQYSQDRTALLYIDRCARFLGAPPPADWDGAEHYDVK
jgi:adenylate cyclase